MMANILRFVLLVICFSVFTFAFLSNTKFLNKGFVNYGINNHVFKDFQMLGGREMANCSQECILENDCIGFELCKVYSSQTCRLARESPNPKPSFDNSAPCQHFIKLSHNLYSCDGFSTTDECIENSPTGTYSECLDCDCVSSYTSVSGVYEITSPVTNNSTQVECVMKDGHGYTVILQRHDGSVDFNRTYAEYRDGFGSPFKEMWLGNEYFHNLTSLGSRLYIELRYSDLSFRYVDYSDVIIDFYDNYYYYLRRVGPMTGNASDILHLYDEFLFGAYDVDYHSCDCPMLNYGGWWDGCCLSPCGLTMPYNDPTYPFGWNCTAETTIKLTSVKMMVRRECFDCDCVSSYTSVSGVYEITNPVTNSPILVECVMMDGYGYTVILQRHDGSVDFNRTYAEYRDGFGSPFTEMWLGNEYFHHLSYYWNSRLNIELKYNDSSFRYVDYSNVVVHRASAYYRLYYYNTMAGNASDVLNNIEGYYFGAHDLNPNGCDCPMSKYGGWWHDCCRTPCGLTMPYNDPTYPFGWDCSNETSIKLTSVKMMTRRRFYYNNL